ncbi:MAG: hypothetical protein R3F05_17625 [Planctomycetota bacterium]
MQRRPEVPGGHRVLGRIAAVRWLAIAALGAVLLAGGGRAEAGAPPLSETYRDRAHKFSLKMFKGFERVPLQPGEEENRGMVVRFADPKSKGQARGTYDVEVEVVKIDTVEGGVGGGVTTGGGNEGLPDGLPPEIARALRGYRPKSAWDATIVHALSVSGVEDDEMNELKDDPDKKIDSKDKPKIPGVLYKIERSVPSRFGDQISLFMVLAVFAKDNVEYGVYMTCGGKLRKSYESSFERIAKSFMWFDKKAEDIESRDCLDGVNISAKRRREIERGLVKGWDVVVSPKKNYVIVYNTNNGKNKLLAKIIAERIEAIREQVYEVQFPPSEPIEAVSIVRICKDRREYMSYGAPGGSAGYWSSGDEELVFYDASPSKKPDDDTLAVLYHEAFHQYIYYSVGNVAPHSWFNEGHGDYYAGAKYKGGKFKIEPFDWRVGTIKGAIVTGQRKVVKEENGRRQYDGNGGYTPLPDFVRFTQGEYYSYPGICYAQGWSLIYFLREIVPKNKKYNEKWGHILQVYFDTLKGEVKLDKDFGGFRPRPRKDDDDDDGDDGDDEDGGGDEGPGDGSPPDTPPGDGGDGGGDPDDPEAANSAPRPTGGFGPQAALDKAVNEAFKDVDWDEFEEAWREGTKRGK